MKVYDAGWRRHHPGRGSYDEYLDGIIVANTREEALGIALEQKDTSTAAEWSLTEICLEFPGFYYMESGGD